MPVRSLRSSVLRWPDAKTVTEAVRRWAHSIARQNPDVVRVGYFGSYAQGNAGVGSDVDVLIIVDKSELPLARRAAQWDTTDLPVPADVLVYTVAEWQTMQQRSYKIVAQEIVWVYQRIS